MMQTRIFIRFKCRCCGGIFDFTCKVNDIEGLDGFDVEHRDVYFSGYAKIVKEKIKNFKFKGVIYYDKEVLLSGMRIRKCEPIVFARFAGAKMAVRERDETSWLLSIR